MSFSWAFQWYHFHLDPIWPDGTFNVPLLLCFISFCALRTLVSFDILIFIERFPNCSWSGPRNIIMEIWRHRVSQTIPKCLWPQVWQLLFQKFCFAPGVYLSVYVYIIYFFTGKRGIGDGETWTREKGQQFIKLDRKYQHDWLYLQSVNSDKHLPQNPFCM